MNSIEAKAQLAARQQELFLLEQERDQLGIELGGMNTQRNAAIRTLARGDGTQRKLILGLEGEMKPLSLRLEGLTGLISEAQADVTEAEATLKAVEAQEAAELAAYIAQREEAAREQLKGQMPELRQKLYRALFSS